MFDYQRVLGLWVNPVRIPVFLEDAWRICVLFVRPSETEAHQIYAATMDGPMDFSHGFQWSKGLRGHSHKNVLANPWAFQTAAVLLNRQNGLKSARPSAARPMPWAAPPRTPAWSSRCGRKSTWWTCLRRPWRWCTTRITTARCPSRWRWSRWPRHMTVMRGGGARRDRLFVKSVWIFHVAGMGPCGKHTHMV